MLPDVNEAGLTLVRVNKLVLACGFIMESTLKTPKSLGAEGLSVDELDLVCLRLSSVSLVSLPGDTSPFMRRVSSRQVLASVKAVGHLRLLKEELTTGRPPLETEMLNGPPGLVG